MTPVFVDTSGYYSLLDGDDENHVAAKACFARTAKESLALVTTNYVIHESWALIQNRLGWEALDAFLNRLLPACQTYFVTASLHALGAARCRQARSRRLSLTDCVSLEFIRERAITQAIAFDEHFSREKIARP